MIDLSRVRTVLNETHDLVDALDGLRHDDSAAITSQTKGALRQARAQTSQDLQLLASRLELAAALVRVEYWTARGEPDPLTCPATTRDRPTPTLNRRPAARD